MGGTNNSLLKTLNLIDSNINEYPAVKSDTYTLDDLLDLENEDLNQVPFYNETPAFDDDTLFVPSTEILMDTALASPLSSSSDESCEIKMRKSKRSNQLLFRKLSLLTISTLLLMLPNNKSQRCVWKTCLLEMVPI